jgi:signal transduction histidine kinase
VKTGRYLTVVVKPLHAKPVADIARWDAVEVQAVGGAGLWRVEANVDQIEAALLNLAVNAHDAMAT